MSIWNVYQLSDFIHEHLSIRCTNNVHLPLVAELEVPPNFSVQDGEADFIKSEKYFLLQFI